MPEMIDKWEVVNKLIRLENQYNFYKEKWDADVLYRRICELEIGIGKTPGIEVAQDDHHWATEQAYKNGYADGQPKWISVKERLPEDSCRVLIRSASGYIGTELYNKGRGQFECCGVWIPVTHWMPLPEAPKGENADRCVSCGEIIPEGRQVCPNCERSVTDGKEKEDG